MKWIDIKTKKPDSHKEVLVWIDGHRGPSWSNNYPLVAYMESDGNFYEERHFDKPIIGVLFWSEIEIPRQA